MTYGAKVLIVEDDFLSAERARAVLDGAGYDVIGVAPRTLEAIELAARHAPDLAIVDLKLEVDIDGFHTATELVRRHDPRILIATGFPDSFVKSHNTHRLACGVVTKPYTDDELLTAVAECLAMRAA